MLLKRDLHLPDFRTYAVDVAQPGRVVGEATREMGKMLRDVLTLNQEFANFRVFGPDETASIRLNALFEVTNRMSTAAIFRMTIDILGWTGPGGAERALVRGLARRLSADRTPWVLLLL